jgi:Secretion system C-terminal sorting domain
MKRIFTIISAVLFSLNGYNQIAAWDFTALTSSPVTFAATTFDANLVVTKDITRGAGAVASSASNSFRTTGFQNNGIATTNTDYFQITLSAKTNFKLSLSTITATMAGTATFAATPGVTSQFAYSLNGTTFTLIGTPQVIVGTPQSLTAIDLTGVTALQNVPTGTTVTIRFYASGQTTTGGWGFNSPSAGTNGLAISGVLNTVLTVDLKSITATKNNNTNKLSWQTASEKNNAYFNIELSQNGETFTNIGQVKGNGTSSVAQNYSFTDATPHKGINYYRLRQVDFDGTESVSKTVSVNFDGTAKNKMKVYPTLVQDNLTVELNGEGKSEITVRDLTGRALLTQNTEGTSTQVLNLGRFSNGLYLLSVRSNDGFETVKIQKN